MRRQAKAGIRVILADDHEVVRFGLRSLLESLEGVEVVAEASEGGELVQLADSLQPDLVFTDISMPGVSGIEAIQQISKLQPKVRCVVVSMADTADVVKRAAASGAAGYLMKNASLQEMRTAVDAVMSKGSYFSPEVAGLLLKPSTPGPADLLTERQVEILKLLAQGLSTKEIAYELKLSPKTVDVHRAHIMERLEITDVANLTRYAIRHGLVNA